MNVFVAGASCASLDGGYASDDFHGGGFTIICFRMQHPISEVDPAPHRARC